MCVLYLSPETRAGPKHKKTKSLAVRAARPAGRNFLGGILWLLSKKPFKAVLKLQGDRISYNTKKKKKTMHPAHNCL